MVKKIAALVVALVVPLLVAAPASAYDTEVLRASGDPANRIDIAILGDGYRTEDQAQLTTDAQNVLAAYDADNLYGAYRNYINWTLVHVISNQTGADDGSAGGSRDTALGAFFNCGGTDRLLCVDNTTTLAVATADVPNFDFILVVVNDSKYGGAGGSQILTTSIATAPAPAVQVPVHELGHSLINLADEYDSAFTFPACPSTDCLEPNVTLTAFTGRSVLKWGHWVDAATPLPTPETAMYNGVVGAFEGARYQTTGVYRPFNSGCLMQVLGAQFCPVCNEAGVVEVYSRVDPIDQAVPSGAVNMPATGSVDFTVQGPRPQPNTLTFTWSIDGTVVGQNDTGTIALTNADFGLGDHTLRVVVHDDTAAVRRDDGDVLTSSYEWTVTSGKTGFPTTDGNDGKFVTVTGEPVGSVQNLNTQFLIGVPPAQTTLSVQVFDGDQSGTFDTNEIANPAPSTARTCFDLYSTTDKANPDNATPDFRVESTTLSDAAWADVYSGNVFGTASGSGAHFYILDVYLTDGPCGKPLVPVTAGLTNPFKVRATGQVSTIANDFSFRAGDLAGPFAIGPLADTPLVDTTYDGTFRFFADVGSASEHITLRDADADVLVDDDPAVVGQRGAGDIKADGVATGASTDIRYDVFDPAGTSRFANTNPSGNNDDASITDVEESEVDVAGDPGSWEWRWSGVHVMNNVRLWAPFGSPVKLELFGEPLARLSPSGARPRDFWRSASLRRFLPIRLGGSGHRCDRGVRDPRTAIAILTGRDPDFGGANEHKAAVCHDGKKGHHGHHGHHGHGDRMQLLTVAASALAAHLAHGDELAGPRAISELAAELLAAKLNVRAGRRRGEDLLAAYVYGRDIAVGDVLEAANDALVIGDAMCGLTDEELEEIAALTVLLAAINHAEVTFSVPDEAAILLPIPGAPGPGSGSDM